MNESKTYRVKSDLVKKVRERAMQYVIEKKEMVDEAEVVNAMILKGLETSKNEDIEKYIDLTKNKIIK